MSSLAIKFLVVLLGIVILFVYILIINSTPHTEYENKISQVSKLLKLPNISLSTSYIESRVGEYDDYSNDFYLGMKKDTYTGFVYEK